MPGVHRSTQSAIRRSTRCYNRRQLLSKTGTFAERFSVTARCFRRRTHSPQKRHPAPARPMIHPFDPFLQESEHRCILSRRQAWCHTRASGPCASPRQSCRSHHGAGSHPHQGFAAQPLRQAARFAPATATFDISLPDGLDSLLFCRYRGVAGLILRPAAEFAPSCEPEPDGAVRGSRRRPTGIVQAVMQPIWRRT